MARPLSHPLGIPNEVKRLQPQLDFAQKNNGWVVTGAVQRQTRTRGSSERIAIKQTNSECDRVPLPAIPYSLQINQ